MITNLKTKKYREYRQLVQKPTPEELKRYYQDIYFQQSKGTYNKRYSVDEINYIKNNLGLLSICLAKIFNTNLEGKTFVDLGCGEGWALQHFYDAGCDVIGIDYSSYGISRFNKKMLKFFKNISIDNFIYTSIKNKKRYDIINLTNIIEHVLDPERLLKDAKRILNKGGIVCVTFPNDFSPLQKLLLKKKKIDTEFWIAFPDHVSYFSKDSFQKFSKRLGYITLMFLADFPIDLFLLNDHSNYIKEKSKGKEAHFSRVDFVNLLCHLNKNETLSLLLKFGEIGIGRNLTAFLKAK